MSKAYVYEMPPTDWFFPFKELDQAIIDAENENCDMFDIKSSILENVENAKTLFREHTLWEGDGEVYISGLPSDDGDSYPLILVVIKQSNNGTTFLCSPVELLHLKEYLNVVV